ncbi:hypothetical protein [Bacillus sp. Marseille-Q1617]|uniref:hypothetical protein n=1 Tax=Bacillus sp. Marseille-Q1617 TaxID=2736887 RepID=UPI00158CC403|nr:hypothetical protein [Bacillus sp. Marseille-Q1617]
MLRNLNELAVTSKEHYQNTFINEEFKLNRDFKERFSQVLEEKRYTIQFLIILQKLPLALIRKYSVQISGSILLHL